MSGLSLEAEAMERVERLMGELEARRSRGEALTPKESAYHDALTKMLAAETEARDAFSAFYAALAGSENTGDPQIHLPVEVAARVNEWIERRKQWDAVVETILAETDPGSLPAGRVRTGPRLRTSLPALFRVPTAEPAKDALSALFAPQLWRVSENGAAILAQRNETQVRIDCDDITGFGPERAIQQIAKYGASAAQTFLTMAGLWLEQNPDSPHETYLTAYASDLLRFQGRRQTPRGGYHADDIIAKGRDVYLLSRISVPRADVAAYHGGRKTVKTLSVGRLLSLEALDAEQTTEDGSIRSVVKFRYHLGREVYHWVSGGNAHYSALSSKLLAYHPLRQKYQILLGFCLAYYDRVTRKSADDTRRISLPTLLNLAAIRVPAKRLAEFLVTIEDALSELARDQVIPGVRLQKPDDWAGLLDRRKTREIIARSVVIFPCLSPLVDNPITQQETCSVAATSRTETLS